MTTDEFCMKFPPDIFNQRVTTCIDAFYEGIRQVFIREGWRWVKPQCEERRWNHPEFGVSINSRRRDETIKSLKIELRGVPGVVDLKKSKPKLGHAHTFVVQIPRDYPANLKDIAVFARSRVVHPRIAGRYGGHACLIVNGDLDRVLLNIVFQVLLEPSHVQPPKLYKDRDFGNNLEAMDWYQSDPKGIHKMLMDAWRAWQKKSRKRAPPPAGIRVLGSDEQ